MLTHELKDVRSKLKLKEEFAGYEKETSQNLMKKIEFL
jgi:hypothetical protein